MGFSVYGQDSMEKIVSRDSIKQLIYYVLNVVLLHKNLTLIKFVLFVPCSVHLNGLFIPFPCSYELRDCFFLL